MTNSQRDRLLLMAEGDIFLMISVACRKNAKKCHTFWLLPGFIDTTKTHINGKGI